MTYRVATYITAYQDVEAVKKCISAIQKQSYPVDKIYIIDNSTFPMSNQILDNHNLIFDHHPENIGIAKGLNIALDWSIQERYDFLWTFDQDSEPLSNALSFLIGTYEKLKASKIKVGIIATLPIDQKTGYKLQGLVFDRYKFVEVSQNHQQNSHYECDLVITSGSLVVINEDQTIPKINENLFIDAVDWDFCLKLKQQKYRIYLDQNAILNHNYGSSYQITLPLLNQKLTISCYSPLRYYYICRNHTYIETRLVGKSGYLYYSILFRLSSLMTKLIKIIFFESDQKLLKIWACFKGTYDGFRGKLGKTW